MKRRHLLWILIIAAAIQSCSRAISPYEAANNPRGKHCKRIK